MFQNVEAETFRRISAPRSVRDQTRDVVMVRGLWAVGGLSSTTAAWRLLASFSYILHFQQSRHCRFWPYGTGCV
jgi:hypothetical protein